MAGRIVVFGDVIDDIVVVPSVPMRHDTDTASAIRHRAGGSAANVASWLGHSGVDVDFVGRVAASDVLKHSLLLQRFGVTPHLTGDDELPTGTIVVIVDGNSRTMLTERGANDHFSADAVTDDLLAAAALVHFTGYNIYHGPDQDAIRRLLARAAAAGVVVSVNPASAGRIAEFGAERFLDLIADAAILLPNLDEGRALTGLDDPLDVASALAERFPLVALTMADQGVIVAERGAEPVRIDAVSTHPVDPTGAGDAFAAGFLAEWVRDGDAHAAALTGVELAAEAVAIVGGRPSPRVRLT